MTKLELFEYLKLHPNGNVQENIFKRKYPEHYKNICDMVFPDDFTFQQKLFHYLNDDYELKLGICPVCGNRCKYRRINEGYNTHCSTKCSSEDIKVQEKSKQTNLEKYGFNHSSKNPEVKKKREQTNLEKYGYTNAVKSKDVINKMIATNLQKYGKPNYSQTNLFSTYHRKRILYNNIYFDSSWEVIFYKYCKITNRNVIYSPDILYKYEYDNKEHYYQPDFYVDGILYEVKGTQFFENGKMINPYDRTQDGLYEKKHQCMMDNGIIILMENEIKNINNKLNVLEYLNSGIDKSGNLKKESGFKKHFPEMYNEYINTEFPQELQNLPFKQKLWHFLNDIYVIPVCKTCGNPVNFLTRKGQWGYCTYCSGSCAMKDENIKEKLDNTKISRYGSRTYNNSEKQKQTILNKGKDYWKQHYEKSIKTRYEKNDGKYFSQETIEKIKNTTLQKYGVDSFTKTKEFQDIIKQKHDDIQKKQYITKKIHHSFKSSNVEKNFGEYLDEIGIINYSQYKSNQYPYSCDFFIPGLNLYIEIQGSWTHGKHPFNSDDKKDNEKLNYWKSKDNEYYNNAIYTWTDLDVRKRVCVRDNHLNYLEIFSNKIDDCITIFEDYIIEKIVDYCLTQELPGNTKWPSNHPIWDCNVGNKVSPRFAWSDRNLLEKAVKNIFYMLPKDEKFRIKHINELLKCEMYDGKIVNTTQKFLQQIQDRFTIAKIAPKVTAISEYSVKNIIDESGIDISRGVYLPMAGFGGIYRAVKDYCIDVEAYDINQRLCDWYGWKQRDMLAQRVVTDKVCICCPPFGKKYEHWEGTPDEMCDIDFKEWYRLIKEYVIAPEYIIIGPEIDKTGTGSNKGVDKNGKKQSGLFTKTVGIMRWTDEMV